MTRLPYSRKLFKRQEVMKTRRMLSMPNAWKFSKDKTNYYLTFSNKLAKRLYSTGRRLR